MNTGKARIPMSEVKLEEQVPERKGCCLGSLVLGCGIVCVVGLLLCGGSGFFGYRWLVRQAEDFVAPFEEQGYTRVSNSVIEVTAPVKEPHVYLGWVIQIREPVDADVALASLVTEIDSDVNGDIDFFGQILTIKPGAVVRGDIRVKGAQLIQIEGQHEGEVTGNYQQLIRPNAPPGPVTEPSGVDSAGAEPDSEEGQGGEEQIVQDVKKGH